MDDAYLTIEQEATAELKIKNSRFIGESFLVQNVADAMARLASIKKREYRTNHHCYAYLIGLPGESVFKYSDDGEPSGTAGRPIYDLVSGSGVTDVLCVVTRYFGGTKLGTGGLVRAYGGAARAVLEKSGKRECFVMADFWCRFDFSIYDRWLRAINELGAEVITSEFAERVTLRVSIRKSRAVQLSERFIEISAGQGSLEAIE